MALALRHLVERRRGPLLRAKESEQSFPRQIVAASSLGADLELHIMPGGPQTKAVEADDRGITPPGHDVPFASRVQAEALACNDHRVRRKKHFETTCSVVSAPGCPQR
jgi:hypothetical protein